MAGLTVLDVRQSSTEESIRDKIIEGMCKEKKELTSLIVCSAEGLRHWDRHSADTDYYIRHEELGIFKSKANEIASSIPDGGVVVESGSGTLENVIPMLEALEHQEKNVTYYALDVSHSEIASSLEVIPTETYKHVRFGGLYGTFDDALRWLEEDPAVRDLPHCVLFLGSSIGSFSKSDAARFLRSIATHALKSPNSSVLVGIDGCKEPLKVLRAYTADGARGFLMSGMDHANAILREGHSEDETGSVPPTFDPEKWYYLTRWNRHLGRQEGSYFPRSDDVRLGPPLEHIVVKKDELVQVAVSQKYGHQERKQLFDEAGLQEVASWSNEGCDGGQYISPYAVLYRLQPTNL
ncbi:dimethylallyltryptophan N-methyltransferase [Aspergillus heteromorphus CBS 117.55]|uniref:4-dimethylallyltryptophan N-methyltransferase n=1 Tax=Aspergillus heteromorphus CBS 117.55 TaxID=1448321 RepID=A0A317WIG7_9EURO|nr:dimethylallyltryptophan N-methyltransferase [Aspergillus heteromorphus CBS 117.55]PWY84967.1 dimethylallyltryptophan N-methyltransferase [Aspergillus heteromorphus CBS 117.55]